MMAKVATRPSDLEALIAKAAAAKAELARLNALEFRIAIRSTRPFIP